MYFDTEKVTWSAKSVYRLVCKFASAFEKCVFLTLLFWICRLVMGKIKKKHSWSHAVCLCGMKVQLSLISKQIYKLLHISLKIEQVYNLFHICFTVKPIQGGRLLLLQCAHGRLHSQFNPVACDANFAQFLMTQWKYSLDAFCLAMALPSKE